jgi:CxxH/CxxC protein (TIGR04129 family)
MASSETRTWYACDEHIDIVLDEIVDNYAQAPLMEIMEKPDAQAACFWCGGRPRYQLQIEQTESRNL